MPTSSVARLPILTVAIGFVSAFSLTVVLSVFGASSRPRAAATATSSVVTLSSDAPAVRLPSSSARPRFAPVPREASAEGLAFPVVPSAAPALPATVPAKSVPVRARAAPSAHGSNAALRRYGI